MGVIPNVVRDLRKDARSGLRSDSEILRYALNDIPEPRMK